MKKIALAIAVTLSGFAFTQQDADAAYYRRVQQGDTISSVVYEYFGNNYSLFKSLNPGLNGNNFRFGTRYLCP